MHTLEPPAPSVARPVPGSTSPIGATLTPDGANVSVYAKRATAVDVLLFDGVEDETPSRVIPLDRANHRTSAYWYGFLPGVRAGQVYGLRVRGPWAPERGLRFDGDRTLIDPYGRGLSVPAGYRRAAGGPAMKSVLVDLDGYDWEGDRPLDRPFAETVIYEAHVRGFTAHPNSGVAPELRGTYAGFAHKIPYLVDLGVTAVELLPVFAFDALEAPGGRPNYWGYQPVSFFAPHGAYSSRPGAQGAVDEFRDLVKALHRAGLEVILDVVFNHTAEGWDDGPTFAYRGLANDEYYLLDPADRSRYLDYSGCGNTLNANEPIVRRMIVDSLRHWVAEMHVDGFRFDLASVLSRDQDGNPAPRPPIIWDIETDPVLAGTKLIAEAWDAAGLYQVGSFAGDRWVEWNGRFRDDVRSFVKSDGGRAWEVGQRLLGSPDIYAHLGREPQKTINFITCHDGFTLNDVVSYDRKHNEANGEDNRDGNDANFSWNCGIEGPTDDPVVESLRERQARNLLTLTLLAVGVPMLTMGDEVRRTQQGNNNAYCHDSELSWFDWSLVDRHPGLRRFCQGLIAGRRAAQLLFGAPTDATLAELLARSRVEWHGTRLGQPDLGESSRSLALSLWGERIALHLILNAYWEPLEFEVPPSEAGLDRWRRIVDTALESPEDIVAAADAPFIEDGRYVAGPRSVVVLAARRAPATAATAPTGPAAASTTTPSATTKGDPA
jgi:glycogen operon protein